MLAPPRLFLKSVLRSPGSDLPMAATSNRASGIFLALVLLAAHFSSLAGRNARELSSNSSRAGDRDGRIFNIFQIVTFPNDPCSGGGTTNGTCYTAEECLSRGGVSSGQCAAGFGVCCVFTIGCGGMSSENCTYFTVNGANAGACTATICPCGNNICQLRLDFNTFAISGPVTVTTSAFTHLNGQPATNGGVAVGLQGNCLTDVFSVTSPDTTAPPAICGTNTGEHMYVDSSQSCNQLSFQIGAASTVANWNIKVTQYSCNFDNLAPEGCTQYFFGSTSGTVQTFNHQAGNGLQLANQNQAQCFRRERGNCRICFSVSIATDFVVSGDTDVNANLGSAPSVCCGYGPAGNGMGAVIVGGVAIAGLNGYDCLVIPFAFGGGANAAVQNSRYCGELFGDGTTTRCTSKAPFMVRFMSDGFEVAVDAMSEVNNNNVGYMLTYFQNSINC